MRRAPRTGFGKVLMGLAEDHDIHEYTALAEALTRIGYRADRKKPGVSRTAVTNWCTGAQAVPDDVLPYIDKLFNLTDEEKRRLAYAYAWEQSFSYLGSVA